MKMVFDFILGVEICRNIENIKQSKEKPSKLFFWRDMNVALQQKKCIPILATTAWR